MHAWIKTSAADKYLRKIEFTKSEFKKINWLEDHKEFELKGDYYDVAKMSSGNKKIILLCFNDKKESELCKAFERQQKKQSKKANKNLKFSTYNIISNKTSYTDNKNDVNYFLNHLHPATTAPYSEVLTAPPDLI